MLLKNITLNGFKSFSRKTEIALDFPVVAFVGPNGSGKSNIADAVRWVIGEQGVKNIRANKQEDLIFAGSSSKAPKGMAEVRLGFDNAESFFPLPYAQIEIGRTIYRDGNGEYWLNGEKYLLRDLNELMAQSGLAAFDLTVIGQGEIDQILIMGSKEIQSLLEDASGVKPFYIKKNRTVNYLKRTGENLRRLQDILGELSPRLGQLRRESKQAQEYLELRQQLEDKQRAWYRAQLLTLDQQISDLARRQQTNATAATKLDQELATHQAEIAKQEKILREQQSAQTAQQAKIDQAQKELNPLWQQQARLRAEREVGERQLAKLQKNQVDPAELEKVRAELKQVDKVLKATSKALDQATQSDQKAREALDALRTRHQRQLDTLAEKSRQMIRQVDLPQLRGKITQLHQHYTALGQQLFDQPLKGKALEQALTAGRELHGKLTPLLGEIVEGVADRDAKLEKEVAQLREQIEQTQTKAQAAKEASRVVAHQVRELTERRYAEERQLQSLQGRLTRLEDLQQSDTSVEREALTQQIVRQQKEEKESAAKVAQLEKEINQLRQALREQFASGQASAEIGRRRMVVAGIGQQQRQTDQERQQLLIEQTRLQTRREEVLVRARAEFSLTEEEVAKLMAAGQTRLSDVEEKLSPLQLEQMINQIRGRLTRIGEVNQKAPQEFAELEKRHAWLVGHIQDIEGTLQLVEKELVEIDRYVEKLFDQVFMETQRRFADYFELLFGGGEGKLQLSVDLFGNKDITIRARPPGKRMHDLNLLSGGERSMGALALLFAILETCRTPFCVLDEVDAALDDANVGRFCQALKRLNQQSQIVLITHNRLTMEAADCLYGATMEEDGSTKVVSLKLQDYVRSA